MAEEAVTQPQVTNTAAEAAPTTRLHVNNLSWNITDEQLQTKFSEFGTVTEATVVRYRRSGRSRGYGFVTFDDAAAAATAVSGLNATEFDARPITVVYATSTGPHESDGTEPPRRRRQPKEQREPREPREPRQPRQRRERPAYTPPAPEPNVPEGARLYVKNLSFQTTDEGLREHFEVYGTVASARIVRNQRTGRSKGYAFVSFESAAQASEAVAGLNGIEVDQREITVETATSAGPHAPGSRRPAKSVRRVYVAQLSFETTEELLTENFAPYGEVTNARIVKNREGESRGYGFVTFAESESVDAAVTALNGAEIDGAEVVVEPAQQRKPARNGGRGGRRRGGDEAGDAEEPVQGA